MRLGLRKLVVVLGVLGILLIGNILWVANWLAARGIVDTARNIQSEYLTGTALTIILVLLILLAAPLRRSESRQCPVCDRRLAGPSHYCSACGSRA